MLEDYGVINVLVTPRNEQGQDTPVVGLSGLSRVRERLAEVTADLSGVDAATVPECVRNKVDALISDVDALLAGDRQAVEARTAHAPADSPVPATDLASIDIAVLASAIAEQLRRSGELAAPQRTQGRRKASGARRRSLISSLLKVDVILSAVALLMALAVLLAWMG